MPLPEYALSIALALSRDVAVRGESVYFTATVTNVSRERVETESFKPRNQALVLRARSGTATFTGHGQSGMERAGFHSHGSKEPDRVALDPGKTMTENGDLLEWLGELPHGEYEVTAIYKGGGSDVLSAPARLRVLRSTPVDLVTTRNSTRPAFSPMTGAWIHKSGDADPENGKFIVFFQEQNGLRPRVPVHGVRAAVLSEIGTPFASTVLGSAEHAHLIWRDNKGGIQLMTLDPANGKVEGPVPIRTPFAAVPLASPLSMADGGAVIPLTDLQRSAVAVLKVEADGRIKTISLPLDGQAPLGPNAWMWLSDSKLHVSWAKLGSRELRVARVPLDDFEAGFTTATVLPVDDPVIWIDGYWDLEGAQQRTPPDDPTPPPDLVLWTVLSPKNRLVVARVNAVTRMVQPSFFIPAVAPLHVTSSVVYGGNEVALLLRDDKGGLHYASSTTKILQPLSGVAGQTILPAQMPSLIASGKGSVQPWVYIRYIAPTGTVAYAKVHPAGIADDTHD